MMIVEETDRTSTAIKTSHSQRGLVTDDERSAEKKPSSLPSDCKEDEVLDLFGPTKGLSSLSDMGH
jgi:hypothetical protein